VLNAAQWTASESARHVLAATRAASHHGPLRCSLGVLPARQQSDREGLLGLHRNPGPGTDEAMRQSPVNLDVIELAQRRLNAFQSGDKLFSSALGLGPQKFTPIKIHTHNETS
jgi:hypothetical protein